MLRPPPSSTLFPYTTLFRSFRITRDGLRVFPRLPKPEEDEPASTEAFIAPDQERLSTGIRRLDEMLGGGVPRDRKSTRLNSSHSSISYAVFCLKKKIYKNNT